MDRTSTTDGGLTGLECIVTLSKLLSLVECVFIANMTTARARHFPHERHYCCIACRGGLDPLVELNTAYCACHDISALRH
jgi:hypothetical protein